MKFPKRGSSPQNLEELHNGFPGGALNNPWLGKHTARLDNKTWVLGGALFSGGHMEYVLMGLFIYNLHSFSVDTVFNVIIKNYLHLLTKDIQKINHTRLQRIFASSHMTKISTGIQKNRLRQNFHCRLLSLYSPLLFLQPHLTRKNSLSLQ